MEGLVLGLYTIIGVMALAALAMIALGLAGLTIYLVISLFRRD